MKVIKWVSYEEAEEMPQSIGGSGGWFGHGMRWDDFISAWQDGAVPYFEALRKEVVEKEIRYNGDQHQHSEEGCPVFDDGTAATFTFRGWGDFMAAAWSEHENVDYSYMDFYC